jgi:hypothetical protein
MAHPGHGLKMDREAQAKGKRQKDRRARKKKGLGPKEKGQNLRGEAALGGRLFLPLQ